MENNNQSTKQGATTTKSDMEASTKRQYEVTMADVPLCCPMPNMRLWDSHPRVYLPIEETGREVCPYCGAEYILKPGISS